MIWHRWLSSVRGIYRRWWQQTLSIKPVPISIYSSAMGWLGQGLCYNQRYKPSESLGIHLVKMHPNCCVKWQCKDTSVIILRLMVHHIGVYWPNRWVKLLALGTTKIRYAVTLFWQQQKWNLTSTIWPFLQRRNHQDLAVSTSVTKARKGPSSKSDKVAETHLGMLVWNPKNSCLPQFSQDLLWEEAKLEKPQWWIFSPQFSELFSRQC